MKVKTFKVDNFIIGKPRTVFLVAEIGINHSGKFDLCKKMIVAAAKSGANAIKLQTIDPHESYLKNTPSYKEFLNKNLNDEDLYKLKEITEKLGMIFFSTPGDFKSLERLKKIGVKLIKISSGLLTNIPLIEQVSRLNIPMIISTGMAYEKEIKESVKSAKKFGNKGVGILKCTSLYPAPDKTINLNGIEVLRNKLKIPVGYSDHTLDDLTVCAAVSLGATIIEKHFTLNKKLLNADHKISMEPSDFLIMSKKIKRITEILGTNKLIPNLAEKKKRYRTHRYIVAKNKIFKGIKISIEDIAFKRSIKKIKKIKPKDYKKVIGKISKVDIDPDVILNKKHFH
tara:strand:+ start:774 stop:1796 length:1023 start_codon:yes stop_codon:yes gene_type:complete